MSLSPASSATSTYRTASGDWAISASSASVARRAGRIYSACSRTTRLCFALTRARVWTDRKSTRLNSSHLGISYAVFCLKKKKQHQEQGGKPRGVAAEVLEALPHRQPDQVHP